MKMLVQQYKNSSDGSDSMSLKLMYITNQPEVARIAEDAGVDRIFVDMEYIGKQERQGGMDTVQSHHTLEDVKTIANTIQKAELLVRINPLHQSSAEYISSKEEIDQAIENGAQVLMLPYFKTVDEVKTFVDLVDGRVKTIPLVETPEAVACLDEILKLDIDEIFIGLNDLSLGYGRRFMFELLADGTVENLCDKFKKRGIPYGFGGIAALGTGMLPAEKIIVEHYRLGSGCAILSRSFCNTNKITDIEKIKEIFAKGLKDIRAYEKEVAVHEEWFEKNIDEVKRGVNAVLEAMA